MRIVITVPTMKPFTLTRMDDEEILQMVADGELDPEQVEEFRDLDGEIQELVESGDLTVDEALEIDL